MTGTMQTIQGRCPACRGTSLFLGSGGHVTCSRLDCPNPCAADDLLHREQPAPAPAAGYCPACGRGDLAPTADEYEQQRQRAEHAEAAIARVHHVADLIEAGAPWTANHHDTARRIRVALDTDTTGHRYLSTGCLHNRHDYCQNHTGHSGAKTPAQCKFCSAPCTCGCHTDTPTPATKEQRDA